MAWALSMGMIRSRESEFGRASSGPTSLRHRATGSKRTRQTRARPGRQTGCRTSHEFADRGDRQIGRMAVWPSVIHHLIHLEYAVGGSGWMPSILAPRRCVNASSPYSANELMRPSGDCNKRISTGTAAREPVKGRAVDRFTLDLGRSCCSDSSATSFIPQLASFLTFLSWTDEISQRLGTARNVHCFGDE